MKIFEGIVVSVSMNNTVVVEVFRRTPHPLYKKLIKRSTKLKADTAGQTVAVGNTVRITETRPISKDKYFKISHIMGVKEAGQAPVKKIDETAKPEEKVEKEIKTEDAKKAVKKPAKKGKK